MLVYSAKSWAEVTLEEEKENAYMCRIEKQLAEKYHEMHTHDGPKTAESKQMTTTEISSNLLQSIIQEYSLQNLTCQNLVQKIKGDVYSFPHSLDLKSTTNGGEKSYERENGVSTCSGGEMFESEELPLSKRKKSTPKNINNGNNIKNRVKHKENGIDALALKLAEKTKLAMLNGTNKKSQQTNFQQESGSIKSLQDYPKEYQYVNSTVYPVDFPPHLMNYVEEDKKLFMEQLMENRRLKTDNQSKKARLQEIKKDICQTIVYNSNSSHLINVIDGGGDSVPENEDSMLIKSEPKSETEQALTKGFEFVHKKYLVQYLEASNDNLCIEVDHDAYRCGHQKLDPTLLSDLKLITTEAADKMFQKDRLKLDADMLCRWCVTNRCRSIKLIERSAVHEKEIAELLKNTPKQPSECYQSAAFAKPSSQGGTSGEDNQGSVQEVPVLYWVGKVSLKKWRNMALEILFQIFTIEAKNLLPQCSGDDQDDTSSKGMVANGDGTGDGDKEKTATSERNKTGPEGTADHPQIFNGDIMCKHKNLSPDKVSKGRLVCQKVWSILYAYFEDGIKVEELPRLCPVFRSDTPDCPTCISEAQTVAEEHEKKKELVGLHKVALHDILNERNRPTWSKSSLNIVYLVSREFVIGWRAFVRNPTKRDEVKCVGNHMLLCDDHGLLAYPLGLDTESDYESVVYMVSEDEWAIIKNLFEVDKEICVKRNRGLFLVPSLGGSDRIEEENGCQQSSFESDELFSSEPKVCIECVERRRQQELDEKLIYTNQPIFVKKLTGTEKCEDPDLPGNDINNGSGDIEENAGTSTDQKERENGGASNDDPPKKRPRRNPDMTRTSNRRQKVMGATKYMVDSTTLLKDFKVRIMETFKVAPFDQHFWISGTYIPDDRTKTLGELRIFPQSLIYLHADEPTLPGADGSVGSSVPRSGVDEDTSWVMPEHDPNQGFKGTGLMSNGGT